MMLEKLLHAVATERKYQIGIVLLIVLQLAFVVVVMNRTRQLSESLTNSAKALLVRTVTMAPGDTAQALCPNGVTTVQVATDKKRIEVFCN